MRLRTTTLSILVLAACLAAPTAASATATQQSLVGGQAFNEPEPADIPPTPADAPANQTPKATLLPNGLASPPALAPPAVQQAIWAANEIIGLPYQYGGGHQSFVDDGYDCSGTVSHALGGAALIKSPLDSSDFMSWGLAGRGAWITVYTNPGHAYVVIAGLRLDTSAADDKRGLKGPRWRPLRKSNAGYRSRHLLGL